MPGPKPRHLKVLGGTLRRERDGGPESPPLPAVGALPEAPDWLPNAHAVREYERLGAVLLAHGLLTEASAGALLMLAAVHGRVVQSLAAGTPLQASLIAQYRGLARDLGLLQMVRDPQASRPPNRFAQYGRRPESTHPKGTRS